MADIKLTKLKPMRDDVVLMHKPKAQSSAIFVKENSESDDLQHFVVTAVGPDASSVDIGDVVVVSWTRVTTPFEVFDDRQEGSGKVVKVGITSHKEILAVVEGATEHDTIC